MFTNNPTSLQMFLIDIMEPNMEPKSVGRGLALWGRGVQFQTGLFATKEVKRDGEV